MTVRIAMVGLGYWGPNLARAFSETPGCSVVAIVDQDRGRREKALRSHPAASGCSDLDDCLSHIECDAVVIATPAATHHELTLKSLRAGKDVFVEKPIALSVEDAREMIALADDNQRILMVGHLLLYHPAYEEIKKRLEKDELGALRYLHARRCNLGIIRSNENALWSLAPHDIAVANWIVGAAPVEAQAFGHAYLQKNVEDVVFYTIRYPQDVIFHGHVSWLDPQKVRELSIIGTRAMAVIDDTDASDKLRIYDRAVETQRQEYATYGQFLAIRTGDILLPKIAAAEPLRQECAHFVHCVSERREPRSNGREGLRTLAVLDALTTSLRGEGRWVRVTP